MTQTRASFKDTLEYHGSTTVEWIRSMGKRIVWRRWLEFDSVDDARTYVEETMGEA
ncbi:MAG: hypothetical protein PVF20_09500 [Desulfobacterales bacterium]|jgi:hypothetical protein